MFKRLFLFLIWVAVDLADAGEPTKAYVPQKSCPFVSTHRLIPDITAALATLKKCEPLAGKISAMETSIKAFKSQGAPITKGPVAEGAYRSYVGVDPTCQTYESLFAAELENAQTRLALQLNPAPSKMFQGCFKVNSNQNELMKAEVNRCLRREHARAMEFMRNQCGWMRNQFTQNESNDLTTNFITQLQQSFDRLLKEDLSKCQEQQNWETIEKTALSTGIQLAGAVAALEPHAAMASMAVGIGAQAIDQILSHLLDRKPPSAYFTEQAELQKVECLFMETLDEALGCKKMGSTPDEVPDENTFRKSLPPSVGKYYFGDRNSSSIRGSLFAISKVIRAVREKGFEAVLEDKSSSPDLDKLRSILLPMTLPNGEKAESQLAHLKSIAADLQKWGSQPTTAPGDTSRNSGPTYRRANLDYGQQLDRFVSAVEGAFSEKMNEGDEIDKKARELLDSVYRLDEDGNPEILDLTQILARHAEINGNDPLSEIKQWELRRMGSRQPPSDNQHMLEMGLTALLENFGPAFQNQMRGFIATLNDAKLKSAFNRSNQLNIAPKNRERFFDGNYLNVIKTCLLIAPSINHLQGSVEKGQKANYNVTAKKKQPLMVRIGAAPPEIETACGEFKCVFPPFSPTTQDLNGEFGQYQCRMLYKYDEVVRTLRNNFVSTGTTCPDVDQAALARSLSGMRQARDPILRGRPVERDAAHDGEGKGFFRRLRR